MAKIDELLSDPDFMSLPENDQNQIIDELRQKDYGAPPNAESLLSRVAKNIGNSSTRGFLAGGAPLSMMSAASGIDNPEQSLPGALQLGGNVLGSEVGLLTSASPLLGGAIGGTIGRTIGEAGKQGVQAIMGDKPFDLGEVGRQSAIGAGTEAVALPFSFGATKALSSPAGKEFRKKTGAVLGGIKDKIMSSEVKTPMADIVGYFRKVADDLAKKVQIHPDLSKVITNIADDLERVGSSKGGMLDPEDLMRAKQATSSELKKLGVFGDSLKRGEYSDVAELIDVKNRASKTVSDVASKAGLGKEFKRANKVFAKVSSDYPKESSKHGILKNILEAGGIGSLLRGQPLEATGNILASEAVGSNPFFNSIYQILKIGKAAPTATAEFVSALGKKD